MAGTRTRASIASVAAIALLGTGLAAADAAPSAKPKPKNPNATSFALKGWGYGTRVEGGQVPAGSGATAHQVIACTNLVGKERSNQVADVTLPGLGTVNGVKTRVWTDRAGGTVSVWARNTIGSVTLSDSPLGTLVLTAVSTTARAYHDASGFKTSSSTDLAKLQFKPPMGPAMTLDLPKPGRPVVIPGVARVTVAHSFKPRSANGASVFANGLKVKLLPTDTTVRVAHAVAQIGSGLRSGVFAGSSYALGGKAAGDVVKLGQNPLLKMPCQGTGGSVKTRKLAGLDLGGQVVVDGAKSEEMGNQNKRRAWGWERSTVASINLGDGALKINGIVGQVKVNRTGPRDLVRNANGTRIGSITVNGERQELPLTQVLEIPGVAKLEPKVVTKIPSGIAVTALRITLLDGTGAVIDLGNARLQIRHLRTAKG